MSNGIVAKLDTLRSLAYGSISGTYAAIGSPLTYAANAFRFINNTNGDMFVSDDGTNDKLFVPAGSFVLYDVASNKVVPGNNLKMAALTQFYVRYSSSPSSGSVYLEIIYQN